VREVLLRVYCLKGDFSQSEAASSTAFLIAEGIFSLASSFGGEGGHRASLASEQRRAGAFSLRFVTGLLCRPNTGTSS